MLGSAQGGRRRALLLQLLHELRALVEGRGRRGLGAAPPWLNSHHLCLATVLVPALQAGVVGLRLAALPALGRAVLAVQAAAAVGLHGGGDEVGAGAGHAALGVVAEGAAQRGRGAEVAQVVGAGGDVLPVGVQPRVLPVGTVAGLLWHSGGVGRVGRGRRGGIVWRWLVFQDPCKFVVAAFAVPPAVPGLAAVPAFATQG